MNTDWVLVIALMRLIEQKLMTADAAIDVLKSGKSLEEITAFLENQMKDAKPKKQAIFDTGAVISSWDSGIAYNDNRYVRNLEVENHPVFDAPPPYNDPYGIEGVRGGPGIRGPAGQRGDMGVAGEPGPIGVRGPDPMEAPVRRQGFYYDYEMAGPPPAQHPIRPQQLYVHPDMAERARRIMNLQQREMDALRGYAYNPPLEPPAPPVRAPIDPLNGRLNGEVQVRAQAARDALPPAVRGNGHRIRQ